MPARLEHANMTVLDVDATIEFLRCIEPAFRILHDSGPDGAYRWVHFGTPEGYFALETPHDPISTPAHRRRYADYGVNHIGLVVEDIAAVTARLTAAGYLETYQAEVHSARIRRYFQDPAGMEWELVQYLAEEADARFEYAAG